ncbi:MAG: hypothetical protein ACE5G0_15920 [Rhodothermales bacterium]
MQKADAIKREGASAISPSALWRLPPGDELTMMQATGHIQTFKAFFQAHLRPWIASLVLLPVCFQFASVGELDFLRRDIPFLYGLLDNLTLVTHEAGHFFFHFFGTFMMFAGGTLLQIILPSFLVWHFFRNDYTLGTQLSLLWLGQSFNGISIYAADARKRILPLLGDNLDGHDWYNMLTRLGMLEWDLALGFIFQALCWIAFLALLLAPRFIQD